MNTTTIQSRAGRWATVAVVAGIAGFPSAAIAGPQPVADIHTVRTDDRPSSTIDDEYRKIQSRPSGASAASEGRPCFIIQSHWNVAYDGFVPVCGGPEQTIAQQDVAEQTGCPPPIDPRHVGVPWVSSVRTGCDNRDRRWVDIADR